MAAIAPLSIPRSSFLGYRLLNETSWLDLGKALAAELTMTAAFIFLATGMVVSGCNPTNNTNTSVAGTAATGDMHRTVKASTLFTSVWAAKH